VFVRTDLSTEQQVVQSGHAIYGLVAHYRPDAECPNHVVIGLPDEPALRRALAKMDAAGIPHFPWTEPDNDLGLTAIATAPLRGDERRLFANYRVLKHDARGASPSACGFTPDSRTISPVTQSVESGL